MIDLETLKSDYLFARKAIARELAMRQRYRAQSEAERKVRVEEMERILDILERWKNALKAHCETEPEQAGLFGEES